ncbi:flavin monoamine oxidase family protein [Microbacterium abyssi]|uniref:flavin monoamine oxidase family protein n=1 Tax=Microbacterium abyssi TaxID=2782166 RepID=UPI001E586023|nr:FAD-dependent oxidoreductase [Microbacterium sp. A18JL241]
MTRRELLVGAGAGALGVLLVSCTPEPKPTPTKTRTPSPLPTTPVPAPAATVRSTWATDPYSRGAVSYTRIGVQADARSRLAEPVDGRVFFAGEATDADNPATIRGAIHSGESAAVRIRAMAAPGERIAVIGAGLAGAAVAAGLADADLDVTVLEARDRVGGRAHSQLDEEWAVPIQLGGWLLPALAEGDEPAREESGLPETTELSSALWRSPEGDVEPIGNAPLETAIAAAQKLPTDIALAEALTETGADLEDPSIAALLSYLATTAGADADVLSSWFPPELPSSELRAVTGDFDAHVKSLLTSAQLTLSSPVTRIAYDDAGVSLRLGTGESTSFDRVVVTVPLGVLQAGGVDFSPPLPFSHRGAINALGTGHIETIWLRYDEPFWETDATIWHSVGGDDPVRTWINLMPATGDGILVGIVGADAAESFAELEDQDALLAALTSLAPFLPPEAG